MATLKEALYTVLETDAKINNAANLGGMIGLSATAPYGVHFRNPPEEINFGSNSIITYFINSMAGRKPAGLRNIYVNITAWGDNYEDILERVYELLHQTTLTGVTDYKPLLVVWDWAGPELYDNELRTYYQQHRYLLKGLKL